MQIILVSFMTWGYRPFLKDKLVLETEEIESIKQEQIQVW